MAASEAVDPVLPGVPTVPAPPGSAPAPLKKNFFQPINAEDEEQQPTEIESLCMNCYNNVSPGRGLRGWMNGATPILRAWWWDGEERHTPEDNHVSPPFPQGTTRLLLTKVPFFREIIVSSFSCEHCGWSNTEIQSAGKIQDQGVCYTLTVNSQEVRAVSNWRDILLSPNRFWLELE